MSACFLPFLTTRIFFFLSLSSFFVSSLISYPPTRMGMAWAYKKERAPKAKERQRQRQEIRDFAWWWCGVKNAVNRSIDWSVGHPTHANANMNFSSFCFFFVQETKIKQRERNSMFLICLFFSNPKHTDDSQWLVSQSLLAHLQDGVPYLSGLQRIHVIHVE